MELQRYEHQLAEAETARAQAEEDLREAKLRLSREAQRVRALQQIVKGLRDLPPDEEPQSERLPVGPGFEPLPLDEAEALLAPRGQEAIFRVMKDSGRDWRPVELVNEIQRRGWIDPDAKTPDAAVRVALRRLVDAGRAEKLDTGLYRLRDSGGITPDGAAPAAEEPEATTEEGAD